MLTFVLAATLSMNCTDVWAPATTEQALVAKFGRANVTRGMVYIAEGEEVPGTILFAKDPKRRVEIVWRDAKKRARPEWLRIPTESEWEAFGLRNGMTLPQVEKRNGRPFTLNGFEWDYGGIVTNWRGGVLQTIGGKACRVGVTFSPDYPEKPTKAQEKALEATGGDHELVSSSPHLKRLTVRVNELIVSY